MNDQYVTRAQLVELEIRLADFVRRSLQASTDAALQAAVMAHTPEIIVPAPDPEPTNDDLKARVDALLIENKHLLSENSRLTGLAWDAEQKLSSLRKANDALNEANKSIIKEHGELIDELQEERQARKAGHERADRLSLDLTAALKRHGYLLDLCDND